MVVHRLLAATLSLTRLPEDAKDGDRLHVLAGNLNLRHRRVALPGLWNLTCANARMLSMTELVHMPSAKHAAPGTLYRLLPPQ